MKEQSQQSHQIIQDDQEESTAERQLEEIDEQMRNWSRYPAVAFLALIIG